MAKVKWAQLDRPAGGGSHSGVLAPSTGVDVLKSEWVISATSGAWAGSCAPLKNAAKLPSLMKPEHGVDRVSLRSRSPVAAVVRQGDHPAGVDKPRSEKSLDMDDVLQHIVS